MDFPVCPRCSAQQINKSGTIKGRQRYFCKACKYYFSVNKLGKKIDVYYVVKALQLYLEGISAREIERILGVSHVSVMNWVRQYHLKAPANYGYHPTYKVFNFNELQIFLSNQANLKSTGLLITEVGDKYMVIKWERFRE